MPGKTFSFTVINIRLENTYRMYYLLHNAINLSIDNFFFPLCTLKVLSTLLNVLSVKNGVLPLDTFFYK